MREEEDIFVSCIWLCFVALQHLVETFPCRTGLWFEDDGFYSLSDDVYLLLF